MGKYVSRFIPDLASTLEPLRNLTRKNVPFIWSKECEEAFDTLKHKLSDAACLAYFDPAKEVVIQVDSSQHGIGAVLLQDGRPIEYASRALTPSERNWAQIEKEALAVLYGLERFDQYTYGRTVTVENDHKPLSSILRKPLSTAPKRLQDLMMRYNRYDVNFVFVKGTDLHLADTLSRAHLNSEDNNLDNRARIMNVNMFGGIPDARLEEIQTATTKDNSLQAVMKLTMEGWPDEKSTINPLALPYFVIRDSMTVANGILLKGEAVVIPQSLRPDIKKRLHSSHLGTESMLRRARGTVFWPGMASDIRKMSETCESCQEMKPKNLREPLKQHEDGDKPWQKIGLDIFQIADKYHLVAVDYYSTFIEVDLLTTLTSSRVMGLLKKHFARYGIPRMIVSDGGPQFSSHEFESFTKTWNIIHVTSSPMHQQANGKAEAAVKSMKRLLIKTRKEGSDPYEALLEHRNTPRQDTGLSPAEMMFNRKTRSFIPTLNKDTNSYSIEAKRQARKDSIKKHYDKKSKNLSELDIGQPIFFQHLEGRNWKCGEVSNILGPNTYEVKGPDGSVYRRNRVHMRPTKVNHKIRDTSPIHISHHSNDNALKSPIKTPTKTPPVAKNDIADNLLKNDIADNLLKNTPPAEPNSLAANRQRRLIKPPIRLNDYVK